MALRDIGPAAGPGSGSVPGMRTLWSFAAGFFTLTLLSDLMYVQSKVLMWKDFSSWLLLAGLVAGGMAVVLWLIGLVVYRAPQVWAVVLVDGLVLAVGILNSLVHAGDGWTGVVPWGVGLSALACLLMIVPAVLRRTAFQDFRHS